MTYFAIFFLNAGLTVPIVFFSVGLPTLMREAGLPLELIGLTAVVYLPYALAFLWAPFVDRRSLNGLGLRRSWLFVVPCLMAMVSVLGAAVPPEDSAFGVLGIAFLVTFLGATARTALLGYVTENVSPDRRPWGAVILPAGGAVGALIGASGLLFLHSQTNWRSTMLIAAAIIALSAVTALAASERNPLRAGEGHTPPSLKRFFFRSDARRVLGFIAPLGVGMGLVFGMLQPQLVDIGFTLEGIGLINGVFICAALFTGGPLAAYLTGRFGLATLLPYGLAVVCAVLLYAAAASHWGFGPLFSVLAVMLFYLSISFVSVATNTLFMNQAASGQEGTDFTAFICANWFASLVGIAVSGLVAGKFGYAAVFLLGALCVLGSLPMTGRLPVQWQKPSIST